MYRESHSSIQHHLYHTKCGLQCSGPVLAGESQSVLDMPLAVLPLAALCILASVLRGDTLGPL